MANIQTFLNAHGFEFRSHLDESETRKKVCVGIYEKDLPEPCNLVRMFVEPEDDQTEEGGVAIWHGYVGDGEKLHNVEFRVFGHMFASIYEVGVPWNIRHNTLCMKVIGTDKELVIDRTLDTIRLNSFGED